MACICLRSSCAHSKAIGHGNWETLTCGMHDTAQHALGLHVCAGAPEPEQYVEAQIQTEKFYTEGSPALKAARLQVLHFLLT